jgi:hypothetical protein
MTMWQSNHHHNNGNDGGNDCFDPCRDRDRCDNDFDRDRCRGDENDRHHGGGWRDQDCHDGGSGHGFFNNDHHGLSVFCH